MTRVQNACDTRAFVKLPLMGTVCMLYLMYMYIVQIRESVDSLCRDGTNMPIVHVHTKAF